MASELGLHPSDPLNMLLHNTPQDSSDSSSSSVDEHHSSTSSPEDGPPDWSELTAILAGQETDSSVKFADFTSLDSMNVDFNWADMNFNPSMAIDPSALHFDPLYTPQKPPSYPSMSDLLAVSFPFTFSSPETSVSTNDYSDGSGKRRMSITSSSSSSGASLSPVLEQQTAVPAVLPEASALTAAGELAQRVRQSAGVMLAVSAGAHAQQPSPDSGSQAKLPIPRLPRPKPAAKPKKNATKSNSPASSSANSPSPSSDGVAPSSNPRPKTSHTTIERRYRTNLNTRIQSLKAAVPALRVLEGGGQEGDVIDSRGFVDGVRVARKGSKANVLGKAVEYIRVLKRRELRLKREQHGLKSLISGLVGGPALLREWEAEWNARFGGEEKDEVEGEDEVDSGDDDDDGPDGEEGENGGDDDDECLRAKKKAKVMKLAAKKERKPPVFIPTDGATVPEKRKRGRPRKNPLPVPSPTSAPAGATAHTQEISQDSFPSLQPPVASDQTLQALLEASGGQQQAATGQSQGRGAHQYLLATFALFSFFNSPITSSSWSARPYSHAHPHAHTGTVLSHPELDIIKATIVHESGYGWSGFIQMFHFIVTILVFFSVVLPLMPAVLRRSRVFSSFLLRSARAKQTTSGLVSDSSPEGSPAFKLKYSPACSLRHAALLTALSPSTRGTSNEVLALYDALGVSPGLFGLVQCVFKGGPKGKRVWESFDQRGLEQRAWVRVGELAAMNSSASITTRLQAYWYMRAHLPWFRASTCDLVTLALVIRPVSHKNAQSLWARALKTDLVRPFERLVLETLSVEEAIGRLAQATDNKSGLSPLSALAVLLVQEKLHKYTAALFIRMVSPRNDLAGATDHKGKPFVQDAEKDEEEKERAEMRVVVDAGRSLGGRARQLTELFERVWDMGYCSSDDISLESSSTLEGDIRTLLLAIVLYRQIFPSSIVSCTGPNAFVSYILSPPPSPSRKDVALHLALRRTLDSPIFDQVASDGQDQEDDAITLEDARDRVVDLLVDLERSMRKNAVVAA